MKSPERDRFFAGSAVNRSRFAAAVLAGAVMAALAPAAFAAPAPGTVELKLEPFEEVVVVNKSGKQEKKLQALGKAVPGKEVVYVITYRNKGDKPADNVVVTNPVPKELLFQPSSVQGAGARFDVSVDGGKTWGALEMLTVPGPDGKPRPAKAEDVTTLRWQVSPAVKPGGEGKVSYRAIVK